MKFLTVAETDEMIRILRVELCPEAPLIEQDLQPFFDLFLPNQLSRLDNFLDFGVGPLEAGAMREVVAQTRERQERLLRDIDRLVTPTQIAVV